MLQISSAFPITFDKLWPKQTQFTHKRLQHIVISRRGYARCDDAIYALPYKARDTLNGNDPSINHTTVVQLSRTHDYTDYQTENGEGGSSISISPFVDHNELILL